MRVALATSIAVGLALIIFLTIVAIRVAKNRRTEVRNLRRSVNRLSHLAILIENEVQLQEDAGYSDVRPFRTILNDHKELQS